MDRKLLQKIKRRFVLDKPIVGELKALDDMVGMVWKMPGSLAEKDWAVMQVDPIAHDAEKIACNFFDTYNPKWDILPFGPEDKDSAEERETWLEWQMQRANTHGETEPFRELMRNAVRQNYAAAQVDFLPYWLDRDRTKWTDAQREAVHGGPFCIYVADRKSVYYEMGKYNLRWVAKVANVDISEIVDHWSLYDDADVKELERELDREPGKRAIIVDYTDIGVREASYLIVDKRETVSEADFDSKEWKTIYSGKNELGFINWAIAKGASDSLFAALHRGNLWQNSNLSSTILRSNLFRRSFYPLIMQQGGTGETAEVDWTGDMDVLKAPTGAQLNQLTATPLDPAWSELSAQDRSIMAQSTSIQTLAGVQPKSNVQFATVTAFVQLSLTALEPYKRTVEKVLAEIGGIAFKWLKAYGFSETSYRTKPYQNKLIGEKISMSIEDFDPESLFISATLTPNTPTDKLQNANIVTQLINSGLPIPDAEHMEKLGYANTASLKAKWEEEQMEKIALKTISQMKELEVQLEGKKAELAMMGAVPGGGTPPSSGGESAPVGPEQPMIPGGDGFNPANGGAPPATAASSLTKTQIPGGGAISNPSGI
jgi:hypothetical protein